MEDERYFTYHYEGNKHIDLQDLLEDCINFKYNLHNIKKMFGEENVHIKRLCKVYGTDPISGIDSMIKRSFGKSAYSRMRDRLIIDEDMEKGQNAEKIESASTKTDDKIKEAEFKRNSENIVLSCTSDDKKVKSKFLQQWISDLAEDNDEPCSVNESDKMLMLPGNLGIESSNVENKTSNFTRAQINIIM